MDAAAAAADPAEPAPPAEPALPAARLAATWAGARDGLWDWDLARGELRTSPRWKELLGYGPHEIVDRPDEWLRRVHPHDVEGFKRALADLASGASARLELELRMIHRSGAWRWVLCRGARAEGAALAGGSLTDVTALKLSENRLLAETMHDRLTGLPNEALFL